MVDQPITEQTRQKLLDRLEMSIAYAESSLTQAIEIRRTLEKQGIQIDAAVLNVFEFVLLLQFDLNSLFSNMVKDESPLRPNLYARLLVLTIHESCLTMRRLLAKEFREELVRALNLKDDRNLRNIHSRFCKLYNQSEKRFGAVRDGIVAHRDRDPEIRVGLIEQADVRAVTDLVIEMLRVVEELMVVLSVYVERVMTKVSKKNA